MRAFADRIAEKAGADDGSAKKKKSGFLGGVFGR